MPDGRHYKNPPPTTYESAEKGAFYGYDERGKWVRKDPIGRLQKALREAAGTCSDSTSLGDALRRVADKLA